MEKIIMKEKLLIFKEKNLKQTINLLILIMVFSGIFGFIYETLFYKIDLGYFVKRGSTYGPWIPIYAFGGLFITLITYRFKEKPVFVFLMNCLITGILEYSTGYVLDKLIGIKFWDYNTEIWNFGNINGYICLRSILFFGISGLFLIYAIIPILEKLASEISEKKLNFISRTLGILFLLDVVIYGFMPKEENSIVKQEIISTEGIAYALTLEDEIENNTIWCGTFQLIWNDLKNDLAKQDIVFTPQLKVVENLNKETFKTSDISDKYYYKKIRISFLRFKSGN